MAVTSSGDPGGNGGTRATVPILDGDPYSTECLIDPMAFGLGIHGCVGKPVDRIEGEAVLGALARRVGGIELSGEPHRHLNNTVRGFDRLPVTFHAT